MNALVESAAAPPVPVFEHFTAFWREVTAVRESALTAGSSEPDGETALIHPGGMARQRLIAFLERQAALVLHAAPPGGAELYREAQYAMVALADEIYLSDQVGGAGFWGSQLLETHFFQTRFAGEAIFARIEATLESPGPDRYEMAAIYLSALALGFRGRYRHRDDQGALARYRARLHALIFGRPARPDARRLIPGAYESTLNAGPGPKLRDPLLWWLATPAVVLLWLLWSTVHWLSIREDLDDRLRLLNAAMGRPAARTAADR